MIHKIARVIKALEESNQFDDLAELDKSITIIAQILADEDIDNTNDTDTQQHSVNEDEAVAHLVDAAVEALMNEGHPEEFFDTPEGKQALQDRINELVNNIASNDYQLEADMSNESM